MIAVPEVEPPGYFFLVAGWGYVSVRSFSGFSPRCRGGLWFG
jgi:hypothetical protein